MYPFHKAIFSVFLSFEYVCLVVLMFYDTLRFAITSYCVFINMTLCDFDISVFDVIQGIMFTYDWIYISVWLFLCVYVSNCL